MTDSEKKTWLQVLAGILAVPLLLCVLFVVLPGNGGGRDSDLASMAGWWTMGAGGAYLLVLSWRAAYLAGRRKR